MSKYHSDFLVPYLKDIFALHLALHKMQERLVELAQQRCDLEEEIHFAEAPMEPRYEAANGVFFLGVGTFSFMLALISFMHSFTFSGWFFVLFGVMGIVVGGIQYVRVNGENSRKEERYNEKLAVYQKIQSNNNAQRRAISAIDNEMRECQREIETVWNALRRSYRANVIPKTDRNMDTAAFLYHQFDTGSADDLNAALELFSLEESKEQLEQIIAELGESILKQYLKVAPQRQVPLLQQAYTLLMESKLDQIDPSDEERKTYLAMIHSNHTTMAYFAKAEYIKQLSA